MFKRYVDDSLQITGGIVTGWEYCKDSDRLIYKAVGRYDELPVDQRKFSILKDIANELDPCIKMEMDVPSLHNNCRLPVLDLEVWINNENRCLYSFYSKDISTPYTILFNSAVPVSTKRTTLLQKGIRRWVNTSSMVPEEELRYTLSRYMNKLRCSGYDLKYRLEVLKGIQTRIKDFEAKILEGSKVRNRSRIEIREQKARKEGAFADNWFVDGDKTQLLMVQYTNGGKLKDAIRKRIGGLVGPDGGKTKLVEKGGRSIMAGLGVKMVHNCPYGTSCRTMERTDCTIPNSVYLWDCLRCGPGPNVASASTTTNDTNATSSMGPTVPGRRMVYVGTTSFTLHKRTVEHWDSVSNRTGSSALRKHQEEYHGTQDPQFACTLVGSYNQTLRRYVAEALTLDRLRGDHGIMNAKSEWGKMRLPRLQITRTGPS